MSLDDLTERELFILDVLLNLKVLKSWELPHFRPTRNEPFFTSEESSQIVKKLREKGLVITEEKDETIYIPQDRLEVVKGRVSQFLENKNIDKETLLKEAEKDYVGVLRLLGLKMESEGKTQISFSDYSLDSPAFGLCERLADLRFLFYSYMSSRKHGYWDFYVRKLPFDVGKTLEDFILGKIDLEGLESDEWWVLTNVAYAETPPLTEDFRLNFPDLTGDEINEILLRLEARGIVSREPDGIKISKGIKDLVKSYFMLNKYQQFKSSLIEQLRRRISRRTSNLYILGLIKKILASTPIPKPSKPFYILKRTSLGGISEEDLKETTKLGIAFLTPSELIIANEVIIELENILKSAILEESFVTVPANDAYGARLAWMKIFDTCQDYIKLEDEWVNEETLMILQSYAPHNIRIVILCSLEGSRDMDIEEMKQRIEYIRNSGRKLDIFLIGYENTEKAPFHERYIISKDICYMISNSIKQVGKSKSTSIVKIPKDRKDSLIEPAFDYWAYTPNEKLKEHGIIRMIFEEWVKMKSR